MKKKNNQQPEKKKRSSFAAHIKYLFDVPPIITNPLFEINNEKFFVYPLPIFEHPYYSRKLINLLSIYFRVDWISDWTISYLVYINVIFVYVNYVFVWRKKNLDNRLFYWLYKVTQKGTLCCTGQKQKENKTKKKQNFFAILRHNHQLSMHLFDVVWMKSFFDTLACVQETFFAH